jgi:hypothetical protein
MNAPDPLAEFYTATPRRSSDLSGRSGSYGQVDEALNELQVPAELDDDGDWTLQTDVGQLALIIDDVTGDLVVVQSLQSMEVEDSADFMHALLRLNFETRGLASFGAIAQSGKNIFVITARAAGEDASTEAVQSLLVDCMRLSRRLDELLGTAPPEPAGGAEPEAGAEPETAAGTEPTSGAEPAPTGEPEPTAAAEPPPEGAPAAAPVAETVFAQPVPQGPPPDAQPVAPEADYPPPSVEPAPAAAQPEPEPSYPPPVVQPEYPPPAYPPPPPDLPPANWYPDPYSQARLRYWDGQQWTEHVAN